MVRWRPIKADEWMRNLIVWPAFCMGTTYNIERVCRKVWHARKVNGSSGHFIIIPSWVFVRLILIALRCPRVPMHKGHCVCSALYSRI